MAYFANFDLGRRSLITPVFILGLFLQASACSGDVGYDFGDPTGGTGGAGIPVGAGGAASGGNPFYGSGGSEEPGTGGTDPYDEKECPEVPPPMTVHECDPLVPENDCESYESCVPYIAYPDREDGCGSPGFGEFCWASGTGSQGDLCSESGTGCDPGFMCVVGAAGGERCAQICVPRTMNNCPAGLICGETDVVGFGVCY